MNPVQAKTGICDRETGWAATPCRLLAAFSRLLAASRFLVHVRGKVRRFCLVHFRKGYVKRQLAARQGECRQCGTCCNLLYTCPLLTSDGRCFAYGRCRPGACKVFPIDRRDIAEVEICGRTCGFRFVDKGTEAGGP